MLNYCTDNNYQKGKAMTLNIIAITYYFRGNNQEALKKWHDASLIEFS